MPKLLSNLDILAPELTITSNGANKPLLTLESTDDTTANQPEIKFYKNSASAASEDIGIITWRALDNGGTSTVYARILGEIEVNTDTSELGKLSLQARNESSYLNGIVIEGTATSGEIDVTIANGAASTTTIAGNLTISGGITNSGTIAAGTWNGTAVASAYLDADTAHLSGTQTFTGNKSFSAGVRYSYSSNAAAASNGAGAYGVGADILYSTGGETVVAGSIYTLRGGVWTLIDADFENRCRDLVGMAVGTNSSTDGMLIKGCVTLKDVFVAGTDSAGMPVYASVTGGRATLVAPTGSGDIVRILGYSLDSSDKAMYFNPDSTYVKIA
tara:strand:- start:1513 stop:2502 length:990 start_codon:yes stop_codon:yes gene_type:complete